MHQYIEKARNIVSGRVRAIDRQTERQRDRQTEKEEKNNPVTIMFARAL